MRKVVFLGNCQARVYRNLYADRIAPHLGDDVSFVPSYGHLGADVKLLMADADVIATQLYDAEANIGRHNIETRAQFVEFPNVTGMFLWPFGGPPHPRNKREPLLPHGPYDINLGDRWLNRKILDRDLTPAEAKLAADEYLALDLAKAANAARLYELVIDRQRQRDAKSGFACADFIERHLHDQAIFLSPAAFTLPLFRHVMGGICDRLQAPKGVIDQALDRLVRTPFATIERPIHPSIIKLFDLRHITPATRYQFCTGEFISLHEYTVRYLQYQWNEPLMEAWSQAVGTRAGASREDIKAALDLLSDQLRTSMGSAACERALSNLFSLLGDHDNAFAAYCHSMVLDPDDAHAVGHYSHLLMLKGRIQEAEQVLRTAVYRWPQSAGHWGRLGQVLARDGRLEEAADIIRRALALHPDDKNICDFHQELQARVATAQLAAE